MTDHDLLIRIDERTEKLEETIGRHLRDHERANGWERRVFLMMLMAVVTALGSLAAAIVK